MAGVVDAFEARGLNCFGPRARGRAARGLQGLHARNSCSATGFRRRATATFTRANFDAAGYAQQRTPVVVKASGLAAGKGVVIADDRWSEALEAAARCSPDSSAPPGNEVVIEEFLQGEEASFIVMADGKHILPLATSQDHKRRDDGDDGPNTGGMGAYSPAPVVTPAMHARIMREVIEPTIRGLAADGMPYTGFLYAGIMVAPDGTPNVLEFNCRFGDPETQPVLMRLQLRPHRAVRGGARRPARPRAGDWDPRAALGVVMAAAGYPDSVRKGDVIEGLEQAAQLPGKVFHAGTRLLDGRIVTNGGRVLCAVGLGETRGRRAARGLRARRRGALERRAVPPRHRLSRHRARGGARRLKDGQ